MHNSILINRLNEARVERTIDAKLWASVNSGCSRSYKNDLGASAKPIGTRDQLLQRFVAGLIILKQQCPITEKDMMNCPAFPQWSSKLIEMGITMDEVHKLWNENCGKLPKVDTTITTYDDTENDNAVEADDEDDEIMTGINLDDEDDMQDTVVDEPVNDTEDVIDEDPAPVAAPAKPAAPRQMAAFKRSASAPEAEYNDDPYELINSLHTLLFSRNSQFTELHGCRKPEESMKFLPKFNPSKEGITPCENLNDFMELADYGKVYALRVYRGGDPNNVQGDCIWCDANTSTSYYVAVTPNKVSIYFKADDGEFTLAYTGNHADFGLI